MSREKDDLAGWMLDGLKAQAGGPQNPNGFWRLFWMCVLNGSDKVFKELQERSLPDMVMLAEKNQGGELEWFCPESIKQALNGKEKAAERFVALALSKEWKPFFWGMGKENGFGKSLAGKAEFWPVGAFLVKALQAGWEPAMTLVPMALECAMRNEEFLNAIRKDHKPMAWNDARKLVIELLVASASSKELAAEKAPKGLEELARVLSEWSKGISEEKRDEISADLMASSLKKGRACALKAREFCPGLPMRRVWRCGFCRSATATSIKSARSAG